MFKVSVIISCYKNEKDIEKIFQALEPSELEQYVELVKKVGIHAETLNKNK